MTFRYKDYRDGSKKKTMGLDPMEFLRRFLLHVLPGGFQCIRHYGFLANRNRNKTLASIRDAIDAKKITTVVSQPKKKPVEVTRAPGEIAFNCPRCQVGRLKPSALIDTVDRQSG